MKKSTIIIISIVVLLIALDYIFVAGPCLNQVNQYANKPVSFDVVFKTGANMDEVTQFANDLKQYYQGSVITKIASENDYIQNALNYWGYTLKTPEEKTNYIKMISAQAMARITIQVPPNNLKTFADFNTFADNEAKKYPDLVLERSSGVGGIDASAGMLFGSNSQASMMRSYCFDPRLSFNTIMHLFTKSQDIKNTEDAIVRADIASARVNAMMYYDRHNSYIDLCTGTSSEFGLETSLDYMKNNGNTFIYCSATSTSWIFAASVKGEPNTVYCTDENGYNSTTTINTIQTTNKCN